MLGQVLVFPVWVAITGMASTAGTMVVGCFPPPRKVPAQGWYFPKVSGTASAVLIDTLIPHSCIFFLISSSEHFMSLNFVLLNVNCTRSSSRKRG